MSYGCGAPIAVPACPKPFSFLGGNWWILILLLLVVLYFSGGCGIFNNLGCNWWIWIVIIILVFPGFLSKFGAAI